MNWSVSAYLWACGFTMAVVLAGFLLSKANAITSKNSKRVTLFASTLAAAFGLWLVVGASLVMQQSLLDLLVWYAVLVFGCFALFWVGVVAGLKIYGPSHEQDFGESSILSMQYLDSQMLLSPDDQNWTFKETEMFTSESPAASGADAPLNGQTVSNP
jgi:hypothetical protein